MTKFFLQINHRLTPPQYAVLSFGAVILAGSGVLTLPMMTTGPSLNFVDALFMATSATCVTGLVVVDPGTGLTSLGQAVLLFLIQIGGLGIVLISTFFLVMTRQRLSVRTSDAVSGSFLKLRRYSLGLLVRRVVQLTLLLETAGALLLFTRFYPDYGREAVWLSVFHSVSAFCNAGFSLFSDSLIRYADDPWVNVTVMVLIVLGGIGFFVIVDVWDSLRKGGDPAKRRLSFHSKIVLTVSGLLILLGAVLLFTLERESSLQAYTTGGAWMRALFQSVTARTAGFNTIDISMLSDASLFTIILLMFVGGAPGSMAGGIKVTTLGVLMVIVFSGLRRTVSPGLFDRTVSRANLERAIVLGIMASMLVALGTLALLVSERAGGALPGARGDFLDLLFEGTSAFGTVGLSTGITSGLSAEGRLLITLLMFVGRLGPLTLVYAIERRGAKASFRYPEEQILIG